MASAYEAWACSDCEWKAVTANSECDWSTAQTTSPCPNPYACPYFIEVKFTRVVELLQHIGDEPIRTWAAARALETAATHFDCATTVCMHCECNGGDDWAPMSFWPEIEEIAKQNTKTMMANQ